jgi:hypothetical protein
MDIRVRILARPDLAGLRSARDLDGLAAALNAEGLLAPQQRFITARAVMAACQGGIDILDALETAATANRAVAWALKFLGQEAGLDIGDPFTQGMVDQLVAGSVLTAAQGAALKAMALQPVVITRDQVNAAMFNPDGTEK